MPPPVPAGHALAPHVASFQRILYGRAKGSTQTFNDTGRLRVLKGDDVAGGVANVLMLTGIKSAGPSTAVSIPDTPQNGKVFDDFFSTMKKKKMGAEAFKVAALFEKAGHILQASRYGTLMEIALAGGHWRQSLQLYSHMVQFRVFPVPRTFNYVMDACRHGGKWSEAVGVFGNLVRERTPIDGYGFTAAIGAARLSSDWTIALRVFREGSQSALVMVPSGETVRSVPIAKVDAGVVQSVLRALEDGQEKMPGAWAKALRVVSSTCIPVGENSPTNSPLASLGAINATLRILNGCGKFGKTVSLCNQLEEVVRLSPNAQTLKHLHEAYVTLNQEEDAGEDGGDTWQQSGLFTVYNWSRSLSLPVPGDVLKSILMQLFRWGKNKSADEFVRMNVELACQNPGDSNLQLQQLYAALARSLLCHPDPFTASKFAAKHEHRVEAVLGSMTSNLGGLGLESSRMLLDGSSVLVVDGKTPLTSPVEQYMALYSHTLLPFGELLSTVDFGVFDTEDKSKVVHQLGKDRAAFRCALRFGGIKTSTGVSFISPVTYWDQLYANRFLVSLEDALAHNSKTLITTGEQEKGIALRGQRPTTPAVAKAKHGTHKSTDILYDNPRVAQVLSTAIMAKTLNPSHTVRMLFSDRHDRHRAVAWLAKFRPVCFRGDDDLGEIVLHVSGTGPPRHHY